MAERPVVVDASAVLALLQGEPFTKVDAELIVDAWISAVNLSEVLTKLRSGGLTEEEALQATSALTLRITPFDETHALAAARLSLSTRRAGLSLGDRACLATAILLEATTLTADRAWAKLDIPVEVVLVR